MKNRIFKIVILFIFPEILFSQNVQLKELQAYAELKRENYTTAIDSFNNLISENPKPEFHLAKAEGLIKLSDFTHALEECRQVDKLKPSYSSTLKLKIYLNLNEKEKAQKVLKENLTSAYKITLFELLTNPEYAGIFILDLDVYLLNGNFYSQTEKQIYQAERLIQNKKYTQALFLVNEIIESNNKIADAHYLKSQITFFEGNLESSLQSINSAIYLKGSNIKYIKQKTYINQELKKFDDALIDMGKLIRLEPYELDHYILKADLLFKNKQYAEAIELTQSILSILPENPELLYLSSKSYFMNEEYFEALKNINQALIRKPSFDFYELRGDIYVATKTFEYAIRDYSMCLDLEAQKGAIYTKKGFARLKLGDKEGAFSDWKKGKRYGSYEAIQYLEKYGQ